MRTGADPHHPASMFQPGLSHRSRGLFAGFLLLSMASPVFAAPVAPQPAPARKALSELETRALAEIHAQRTDGVVAVQPWAQLLGGDRLGVGWVTSTLADGVVEWTQDPENDPNAVWREAWFSEDGLKQANGTSQRAVISGYDPARPFRFRVRSRPIASFKPYKVAFGEPVRSEPRSLGALMRPGGAVSFVVLNDIHNRVQLYPLLLAQAGGPSVNFAVLNGDVLQDPQNEKEIVDNLLLPLAWFTSRAIPCFFLRGNHETRGVAARHLKSYLTLPENRYYTAMTFGATRVVFLDCGEDKPDASGEYSGLVDFEPYMEEQLAWLKREIAGQAFQRASWRVVVVHIPPDWRIAEDKIWHGARRIRDRFAPVFDEGSVTAVISGHTHRAELVEPCPDPSRGFRWPVFIGGAHPLERATVIRVDADENALTIRCIRSDGSLVAERNWRR